MPRIATLISPRHIEIQEHPPLKPSPFEAIIAVDTAGICGTDLALFSGDYSVPLPLVPGHEFTGKVIRIGDGLDKAWLDENVTAEINNTCLAYKKEPLCQACRLGIPSQCITRTVTGITNHPGAFADEVRVAAGTLHKIPKNLDPLAATLTEPLAAALQTFQMTPVKGDEIVVIIGPGRLGILIIFVAALRGLNVIAVSRSEKKRKRALAFGAASVCSPKKAENLIKEQTKGLGADIVVDATGNSEGFHLAQALIRPRGTISVKTTCGLAIKDFDMTKMVVDEIRVQGSRCGPFKPAIELLEKHQDTLKKLITSVKPLEEVQSALQAANIEEKVLLKVAVE